jgi:hypothetical protein
MGAPLVDLKKFNGLSGALCVQAFICHTLESAK